MADAAFDSGKQSAPYLTDFPAKVQHGWFRSGEPDAVLSCEKQPDAYICLNGGVNCRVVGKTGAYEWRFNIFTTGGKQLRNVALLSNDFRDNFELKSVQEDGAEIGATNGNEWHNPSIVTTFDPSKKRHYTVTIAFTASNHGTYRQNVIFGFRRNPVYLEKICADYLPSMNDYRRIQLATKYQIAQMSSMWGNPYEFDAPFMSLYTDPREIKLSRIYPLPDGQNFFLTQDTLSEKELTPQNYRGRLHEMITLEEIARHEQLSRYNHITYVRLISSYELANSNSTETKYAPPGELFAQLLTNRDILEDTQSGRIMQRSCNSVLLKMRCNRNSEQQIFQAYIEDKCPPFLFLRLSKDCVNFWHLAEYAGADVQIEVQFMLNRLNFCEWHLAVDALQDVNLVFLRNEHLQIDKQIIHNFLQIDADDLSFISTLMLNSVFNQEQKQAATVMTLPVKTPSAPVLLLGPFGTGKTFTLAHVLYLLVQNPDNRILLCTHSNSAADLYIKECFHFWYTKNKNPRFKPVRIYYQKRALNTVHPVVRQYCLMDERQCFRDPEEKDLRDCGLIVTTLGTSSCLIKLDLDLTHIIIDEAAQAFECEALVALTLASAHTRLILAGDHMQLAPEIYSVLASNLGLGISLLERMNNFYPTDHPCRIHLCQNYRAHKDIINYTSETFYNGKVKSANTELNKHPIFSPLTFCAVYGQETKGPYSPGYYHSLEAQKIAEHVQNLKNTWPTEQWGPYGEESIGVLAYYPEQVLRLRRELRNRQLSDVSVERVLNVQGKQFTAVFISTVRTRVCDRSSAEAKVKDYGFLTDPRLLNTALTRAKCLVMVFGDPIALLTIGSCKDHWRKYIEAASLYGIDLDYLKAYLMDVPKLQMCPLNPLAEVFVPRVQPAAVIQYVPVTYNMPVIRHFVAQPLQTNVLVKTHAMQSQSFSDFAPPLVVPEYCYPF